MTVDETLKELVSIDSTSSRTNTGVIDYLERRLQASGFETRRMAYHDDAGVEKINLVGVVGPDHAAGEIELAFVGHTDTVPFASDWTDALQLRVEGDRLVGRGACDTKGFIASVLTAVEKTDLTRLQRPLALIFTADEEVGCIGAKRLADARPFRVKNAIVGEPTSLRPMRAGKGYCLAEVIVTGREGHSAYPAVGVSAIYTAARLVSRVEEIARQLQEEVHPDFDPPYTTINVGLIKGGTAKNIIPGECHFTLEWRPIPGQKPDYVLDHVRSAIETELEENPGPEIELLPLRIDGGMENPADAPLVLFLEEATGNPAGTIAFGTEAPQMIELGAHAVVFGPGDIRVAHRTGEYVPVNDLNRCVGVLTRAIERFCL